MGLSDYYYNFELLKTRLSKIHKIWIISVTWTIIHKFLLPKIVKMKNEFFSWIIMLMFCYKVNVFLYSYYFVFVSLYQQLLNKHLNFYTPGTSVIASFDSSFLGQPICSSKKCSTFHKIWNDPKKDKKKYFSSWNKDSPSLISIALSKHLVRFR